MTKTIIRFSTENKAEFGVELREKVRDYFSSKNISKSGNIHLLIKSVCMILLYLTPYLLMLTGVIDSAGGILICWIIMGLGMAGIGMSIMHDANHGAFSENSKLNTFISKSLFLLGGFPYVWQYQHNTLHHGFTNIEGHDEDINPVSILRFSPHKPLRKIHRFQYIYAWFFYGLMTIAFITTNDFNLLRRQKRSGMKPGGKKTYRKLYIQLIISKLMYYLIVLAVPMFILPVPWFLTLLFFLCMHFISGIILSTIFQTAHVMPTSAYPLPDENGNMESSWIVHQLQTTTDYAPRSKVFAWFVGGLNHQVIHHLFPNISHVHYSKIAVIVSETARKYNIPYYVVDSFYQAVKDHMNLLKSLGRKNTSA